MTSFTGKTTSLIINTIILCSAISLHASNDYLSMEKGFTTPPDEFAPRTWWHWINGNVSEKGITADLEAMRNVGIVEAQIFSVDQGFPEGDAEYLSDRWLKLVNFAAQEANRLGMELGFHNGAGWSSSGGPWITPDLSMQTVVYSEAQCSGGKKQKLILSEPKSNRGFYRDIAVLAFPTPAGHERIADYTRKSLSDGTVPYNLQPDITPVEPHSIVYKNTIINITGLLRADGTLNWNAPQGEWTILRIGHTTTGTENHPAEPAGRGLECDKMNPHAIEEFWRHAVDPILNTVGQLTGNTLTNCLIDSYEVGCGNWTRGFENEFDRICGYDCITYLPTLAGYYVESSEVSERFLWDYRNTIGELMSQNYYGRFRELCHEHGLKFSVEPYGGPYNNMTVGNTGDIVMSEFWVGGKACADMSKLTASVAHLNGSKRVGAEAFTADAAHSRWLSHPASMKTLGDWAWSEGVNSFIFHTYTHQPWDIAPGMTFGGYGIELSRHNTWWNQSEAYMRYIARSQYMLQQGCNVADILVFIGEDSPNKGCYRPDIKSMGYDYDEIDMTHLSQLTIDNGQLVSPGGGRYSLLVLPDTNFMTPELASLLRSFASNGVTIIGPRPEKSPSLRNYPQCDDIILNAADNLWDKNGLIKNVTVAEAVNSLNLPPDFNAGRSGDDILFIHRAFTDTDIYFLSNQEKVYRTETCRFRVTDKYPQKWNPETGKISPVAVWNRDGDYTVISLDFAPEEAFFVVFSDSADCQWTPVCNVTENIEQPSVSPHHDLQIVSAEYGHFLPDGIVDLTRYMSDRIVGNKINIAASNEYAGDPAPGVVKELRVEYTIGGITHKIKIPESHSVTIPRDGEKGEFALTHVLYGHFPDGFDDKVPPMAIDVRPTIERLINQDIQIFTVCDSLIPEEYVCHDVLPDKLMKITYLVNGETFCREIPQGKPADLRAYRPQPKISADSSSIVWETPLPGTVRCVDANNRILNGNVECVPTPFVIDGPWHVSFKNNRGSLTDTIFTSLHSWPDVDDDAIRYYSGTAIYRTSFILPDDFASQDISFDLNLGRVGDIADVIVNGQPAGVLWHAPYIVRLEDLLHSGVNTLEIHVTNRWPNKLIGDSRQNDNLKWNGAQLKEWPDFTTINDTSKTSTPQTFTVWKHWNEQDTLLPSGLIGPVVVQPYARVTLHE